MRQRGFVSLLTCIFISLLLVIIATSIISIETLQLRKSEDAEQSVRAYYAAESGVEDAVAKVLSGTAIPGGCNTNPGFDAGGELWTCQQVTLTGSPTGKLDQPDTAVTIDPGHVAPPYRSVVLEWHQSPAAGGYSVPAGAFPCDPRNMSGCPPPCNAPTCYNYSAPPLEVSVVEYPNGNFRAGDPRLALSNALIVPGGPAAGGLVPYGTFLGHGPYTANCNKLAGRTLPAPYSNGLPSTQLDYNCWAVITNLNPGNQYLFRIRTRYLPSQYQLVFKQSAGGGGRVIDVPTGMAMIDVTAKAGTSYRRVISQLPLNPSAAAELNYVIYSDTFICKDFNVINNNPPANGCPYP